MQQPLRVRGLNFSDTGQMLPAAILGYGVCLATTRQADQPMKKGRLVPASHIALARAEPIYMSCWERNLARHTVNALWVWSQSAALSAVPGSGQA